LWIARIAATYFEPGVFTTHEALTEGLTGRPRHDANVHRLLNRLAPNDDVSALFLVPTLVTTSRAAALRTRAVAAGAATSKRPISVTDALLVALAEERSASHAVTILTGDSGDIGTLVELTGATNIAVQVV
jgi:predicted nucleic acid-binding protein